MTTTATYVGFFTAEMIFATMLFLILGLTQKIVMSWSTYYWFLTVVAVGLIIYVSVK